MSRYIPNRACSCSRCKVKDLTGPAYLITVGVLFTLHYYAGIGLDKTWPAFLIVTGLLVYATRAASTEGHVQPPGYQDNPPAPPASQSETPSGPEVHS